MKTEYKKIPKLIERKEEYAKGANVPTEIEVYTCFCGKGTIEHHRVPGFDDDFFVIECRECEKKYSYVERVGNELRVYIK